MKTLIILLLLLSWQSFGQTGTATTANVGTLNKAAVSYIVKQGFEGTGYDNSETWSASALANPDYTITAIEGSQSLQLGVGAASCYKIITDANELWCYALVQMTNTSASLRTLFALRNGASSACINVLRAADGRLACLGASGSGAAYTTGTMNITTNYNIWFHYRKGTGSDSFISCAFSLDGTEPTAGANYAQKTTETGTNTVTRFYCYTDADLGVIYDHMRARTDQTCGNNPE